MADRPVVHFDIPAADVKAASEFYANVFGWPINRNEEYNYYMFDNGGGQGGGFVDTTAEANQSINWRPGEVLIYLGTDDMEGDLEKVTQHGGKVLAPPMEVPGGRWTMFIDNSGNRIGLWQNAPTEG